MLKNKSANNNKRLERALFLVPQKFQLENVKKLDAEMTYVLNREAAQKSVAIEVDRDRLVKRGESPTDLSKLSFADLYTHNHSVKKSIAKKKVANSQAIKTKQRASLKALHDKTVFSCPEPLSLKSRKITPVSDYLKMSPRSTIDKLTIYEPKAKFEKGCKDKFIKRKAKGEIAKDTKACVRMFNQEWSGKYKFNLVTGALGSKVAPPVTSGERITKELTKNASRNILESGAYLSTTRAGYTTFLTLTFDEKSRQDLEKLTPINRNVTKRYRNEADKIYVIECFSGVPYCLGDTEHVKNAARYSNAIESSGAFTPVSFEPKTTIGREVSRFFDGAQKVYQRGFVPESITETREYPWGKVKCQQPNAEKIQPAFVMYCPDIVSKKTALGEVPLGFENAVDFEKYNPRKHTDSDYLENSACFGSKEKAAPLDYMWVAEQPTGENGNKNPHVHVLMRWQVKSELFQAWAKRLERLWGHGFAKLERIKTPEAASNYLLKAVGYLTKGAANDQGKIKGNRYGISASARAPKFECIGEFYADNFLAILGELREKLARKKAYAASKINAEINKQTMPKADIAKLIHINKKTPSEARAIHIERLKKQLIDTDKTVKAEQDYINQLPFINDYSIGGMSEEQASDFLSWAMRERWWNAEIKENRYSQWQELKDNAIKAIKQSRRYLHGYAHLMPTCRLTWLWAEENNQYEPLETPDNSFIDSDGIEWERVA